MFFPLASIVARISLETGMKTYRADVEIGNAFTFLRRAVSLRKYRILSVLFLLTVVMGIQVGGIRQLFRSIVVLQVRTIGDYGPPDPQYSGKGMVLKLSASRDFMDEVEAIRSRYLAEKVVNEIGTGPFIKEIRHESSLAAGIKKLLNRYFPGSGEKLSVTRGIFGGNKAGSGRKSVHTDFERAVSVVMRNTKIGFDIPDRIITVTVLMENPGLARDVVSRLIAGYSEQRRESEDSHDSYNLLSRRADSLSAEIAAIDTRLASLRSEMESMPFRHSRAGLLKKIAGLQQEIEANKMAGISIQSRIDARERLIRKLDGTSFSREDVPGESLSAGTARGEYGRRTMETLPQSELRDDTLRKNRIELVSDYEDQAALQLDTAAKYRRLDTTIARLKILERQEENIRQLERERAEMDARYRKYSENMVTARFYHLLYPGRFPLVRVVRPASVPEPLPFSRARETVPWIFLGMFLCVGYPVIAEYMCRIMRPAPERKRNFQFPENAAISERLRLSAHFSSGDNRTTEADAPDNQISPMTRNEFRITPDIMGISPTKPLGSCSSVMA